MDAPAHVLLAPARFARFWSYVDRSGDCWIWTRALNSSGYGVHRCGDGGQAYTTMAHRAAWIMHNKTGVPDGLHLDHLCGTRSCVRPDHLDVVTQSENVRRSSKYAAGESPVVRRGPVTLRQRGQKVMCIWREFLEDGSVRQCGVTHQTREAAIEWRNAQEDVVTAAEQRRQEAMSRLGP